MRVLCDEERARESLVRMVKCPRCGSLPGKRCHFGLTTAGNNMIGAISHTGRYLAAVEAGFVPALVGVS